MCRDGVFLAGFDDGGGDEAEVAGAGDAAGIDELEIALPKVEHDGVALRAGRERADLWNGWAVNATLTLRDVDYDVTGEQYGVRIAGIAEEIAKPADGARWGESVVKLPLVEV